MAALSTLSPAYRCAHTGSCSFTAARKFFRVFCVIYGSKVALTLLIRLIKKKAKFSLEKDVKEVAGEDSVRFALFLGGFAGSYTGFLCLLRKMRGVDDSGNALVAGFLSSLFAAVDNDKGRRHTIAIYLLARTIDAVFHSGERRGFWRGVPYGAVFCFALCQIVIMYGFILKPSIVSPYYYKQIRKWGAMDEKTVDAYFRGRTANADGTYTPMREFQPCNPGHHEGTCTEYLLKDTVAALKRSYKTYIPLVFIPLLLTKHKQLRTRPVPVLTKGFVKLTRSALFLTTYIQVVKTGACLSRNSRKIPCMHTPDVLLSGFATGSSLLWEPEERHRELMLFCLPRAMEAGFRKTLQAVGLRSMPYGEVLLFMCAAAPMLAIYERRPDHLRPFTHSILARLLKTPQLPGLTKA